MSVLARAARLTAAGQRDQAIALVTQSAAEGDAEALFALGNWRLFGLYGPRDLPEAHRLLSRAGACGSDEAIRTLASLTANGTGCDADFAGAEDLLQTIRHRDANAGAQFDMLAQMPDLDTYDAARATPLCDRPIIKRYDALLTAHECAYLMDMALPQLRASFVTNPVTGAQMPHPIRTSMGMSFGPTLEDLVVRRLNERIAHASGTQVAFGEPLHVLRYDPGQEYKPHTDSLPGEPDPRAWTVLIYLNDGFTGGMTSFPRAGIEFRGAPGDAVIFRNLTEDGRPDPDSMHAGCPVDTGVKWLATRWIRTRAYQPWA